MSDHDAWVENVGLEKLNQIYRVENARLKILGPDGVVVNWSVLLQSRNVKLNKLRNVGPFPKCNL